MTPLVLALALAAPAGSPDEGPACAGSANAACEPGEPSTLRRSHREGDGGWSRCPPPIEDDLHDGHFVDPLRGFLVTHHTGKVLATTDGGVNWQTLIDLEDGYLESIRFFDAHVGLAAGEGGRLLRTEDGGRAWTPVTPAPDVAWSRLQLLAGGGVFALGHCRSRRSSAWWWSGDRGLTWRDRSDELPPGRFGDAVAADASSSRLAVLVELLSSADGGATWSRQRNPLGELLRGIAFHPLGGWLAVGDADEAGHGLWSTRDGGTSWRAVDVGPVDLHRLVSSGSRLWAIGRDGALLSWDRPRRNREPLADGSDRSRRWPCGRPVPGDTLNPAWHPGASRRGGSVGR
ncbi:MAG: hypothetical protein KJ067_18255 [Vicinamibacteria bacterium]|nr:hypothetical protein [Vicinamibacteria bacterium]